MCYMAVYTGKMQAWLHIALIGHLQPNISVTGPVRKEVSTDHLYETTYRGKNDHVTDDVTLPRKVKTVTQIHLMLNISKSLGDRALVPMEHL